VSGSWRAKRYDQNPWTVGVEPTNVPLGHQKQVWRAQQADRVLEQLQHMLVPYVVRGQTIDDAWILRAGSVGHRM
jgi:hypothetical protein